MPPSRRAAYLGRWEGVLGKRPNIRKMPNHIPKVTVVGALRSGLTEFV